MSEQPTNGGLKQKIVHELVEYWIIFAYLAVFFSVFANYERLILKDYSIHYAHYGIALVKALILAKFIMLIVALKFGRRLEQKPLIYSTLYKAAVFTVNVLIFDLIEEAVRGLWKGKGFPGIQMQFASMDKYAALANCMVIFFAFIPYFAFRELGRIIGKEKMVRMFFRASSSRL
jgi:hypothetical protein